MQICSRSAIFAWKDQLHRGHGMVNKDRADGRQLHAVHTVIFSNSDIWSDMLILSLTITQINRSLHPPPPQLLNALPSVSLIQPLIILHTAGNHLHKDTTHSSHLLRTFPFAFLSPKLVWSWQVLENRNTHTYSIAFFNCFSLRVTKREGGGIVLKVSRTMLAKRILHWTVPLILCWKTFNSNYHCRLIFWYIKHCSAY